MGSLTRTLTENLFPKEQDFWGPKNNPCSLVFFCSSFRNLEFNVNFLLVQLIILHAALSWTQSFSSHPGHYSALCETCDLPRWHSALVLWLLGRKTLWHNSFRAQKTWFEERRLFSDHTSGLPADIAQIAPLCPHVATHHPGSQFACRRRPINAVTKLPSAILTH